MIEIDEAHIQLIKALIMSHKPKDILEVGLGTGKTSRAILDAIEFNGIGHLTIVENLYDFGGAVPPHAEHLQRIGAEIVYATEEEFVKGASDDSYDFIVSDADHFHANEWFNQYIRIARPNAILAFHDTAADTYLNLREIKRQADALAIPYREFATSSRSDEQCDRGLLVLFTGPGK